MGHLQQSREFHIRISQHCAELFSQLHLLRQESYLCDTLLMSKDGKSVNAHSCVLAASSSYLKEVLTRKKRLVEVNFASHKLLSDVIAFLYTGNVNVNWSDVKTVLKVADQLQLYDLKQACESIISATEQNFQLQETDGVVLDMFHVECETTVVSDNAGINNCSTEETPLKIDQVEEMDEQENDDIDSFHEYSPLNIVCTVEQEHVQDVSLCLPRNDQQALDTSEDTNSIGTIFDNIVTLPIHTQQPGRPWLCELCFKEFPDRDAIVDHRDKKHAKRKLRILPTTNMVMEYAGVLTTYKKGQTVGKVELMCEKCSKVFKSDTAFNRHQLSHADDKPFKCEVCGKGFLKEESMIIHRVNHGVKRNEDPMDPTIQSSSSQGESKETAAAPQDSVDVKQEFILHTPTGRKKVLKLFKCPECLKVFGSQAALNVHLRNHTGEKPYPCDVCDKAFKRMSDLKSHKRMIHSVHVKRYICTYCGKGFVSPSTLEQHERIHTKKNDMSQCCPVCGKYFRQASYIKSHLRYVHYRELSYICQICNKPFPRESRLKRHMNSRHSNVKPHSCQFCGRKFKEASAVRVHELIHTVGKQFKCQICDSSFVTEGRLRNHHAIVHTRYKPFLCQYCDLRFQAKCALMEHERIHTGEKPFTCSVCGKKFRTNPGLKKHATTHFKPYEKQFPCSMCSKRFAYQHHLSVHKQRCHTVSAPVVCAVCYKEFRYGTQLNIHMRLHTGERPFSCKVCNEKFTCSASLFAHKQRHTDVRPYSCQYCPLTFKLRGTLNRHEKLHLGLKPHICSQCGKAFSTSWNLKKHENTH